MAIDFIGARPGEKLHEEPRTTRPSTHRPSEDHARHHPPHRPRFRHQLAELNRLVEAATRSSWCPARDRRLAQAGRDRDLPAFELRHARRRPPAASSARRSTAGKEAASTKKRSPRSRKIFPDRDAEGDEAWWSAATSTRAIRPT